MTSLDETIIGKQQEGHGVTPLSDETVLGSGYSPGVANAAVQAGDAVAHYSRYEVLEMLGEGGVCQVNRMADQSLKRQTALKYLRPEFLAHDEARLRFEFEAQITAQLEHPNIIPIHEYYFESNACSINMKLVEGTTLEDYIKKFGVDRLDHLDHILNILLKVLDALRYAHSRGVIHRDIKPANIMIGQFGEVYLMDWGIVKLFREVHQEGDITLPEKLMTLGSYDQGIIGTPAYMSPEQANGLTEGMDGWAFRYLLNWRDAVLLYYRVCTLCVCEYLGARSAVRHITA